MACIVQKIDEEALLPSVFLESLLRFTPPASSLIHTRPAISQFYSLLMLLPAYATARADAVTPASS